MAHFIYMFKVHCGTFASPQPEGSGIWLAKACLGLKRLQPNHGRGIEINRAKHKELICLGYWDLLLNQLLNARISPLRKVKFEKSRQCCQDMPG
jgi:hypothetical protein